MPRDTEDLAAPGRSKYFGAFERNRSVWRWVFMCVLATTVSDAAQLRGSSSWSHAVLQLSPCCSQRARAVRLYDPWLGCLINQAGVGVDQPPVAKSDRDAESAHVMLSGRSTGPLGSIHPSSISSWGKVTSIRRKGVTTTLCCKLLAAASFATSSQHRNNNISTNPLLGGTT